MAVGPLTFYLLLLLLRNYVIPKRNANLERSSKNLKSTKDTKRLNSKFGLRYRSCFILLSLEKGHVCPRSSIIRSKAELKIHGF